MSASDAARSAYQDQDLPSGVKGALEIILDPSILLPVVGAPGAVLKYGIRTAAMAALSGLVIAGVSRGTVRSIFRAGFTGIAAAARAGAPRNLADVARTMKDIPRRAGSGEPLAAVPGVRVPTKLTPTEAKLSREVEDIPFPDEGRTLSPTEAKLSAEVESIPFALDVPVEETAMSMAKVKSHARIPAKDINAAHAAVDELFGAQMSAENARTVQARLAQLIADNPTMYRDKNGRLNQAAVDDAATIEADRVTGAPTELSHHLKVDVNKLPDKFEFVELYSGRGEKVVIPEVDEIGVGWAPAGTAQSMNTYMVGQDRIIVSRSGGKPTGISNFTLEMAGEVLDTTQPAKAIASGARALKSRLRLELRKEMDELAKTREGTLPRQVTDDPELQGRGGLVEAVTEISEARVAGIRYAIEFLLELPDELFEAVAMSITKKEGMQGTIEGMGAAGLYQYFTKENLGPGIHTLITIGSILGTNQVSGPRLIVHELSHHLEQFMPESVLNELFAFAKRDVKKNGPAAVKEYSAAKIAHMADPTPANAFRKKAAQEALYKYTNMHEYIAELFTDKFFRDKVFTALRTGTPLEKEAANALGGVVEFFQELMVAAYNFATRKGRYDVAEIVWRGLKNGDFNTDGGRVVLPDDRAAAGLPEFSKNNEISDAFKEITEEVLASSHARAKIDIARATLEKARNGTIQPDTAAERALTIPDSLLMSADDMLERVNLNTSFEPYEKIQTNGGLLPEIADGMEISLELDQRGLLADAMDFKVMDVSSDRYASPHYRQSMDDGDGGMATWLKKTSVYDDLPPGHDRLLRGLGELGIMESQYHYGARALEVPSAPAPRGLKRVFNEIRAVSDNIRRLDQPFQSAYLQSTRYIAAGIEMNQARLHNMIGGLTKVLGEDVISGKAVVMQAYLKRAPTPAERPYVNTLWHILDNFNDYSFGATGVGLAKGKTSAVESVIQMARTLIEADLNHTISIGVPVHRLDKPWIAHSIKTPEKANGVMNWLWGGKAPEGKGGHSFSERHKTSEEFLQMAQDNNLEIDLDIASVYSKRLTATLFMRGENMMLESLVKKGYGRAVSREEAAHIGEEFGVSAAGRKWLMKDDYQGDIKKLIQGLSGNYEIEDTARIIQGFKSVMLNMDMSVIGARQGLLTFVRDPAAWARSMQRSAQYYSNRSMYLQRIADTAPRTAFWTQHGAQFTQTPEGTQLGISGIRREALIEKVPGLKSMNNMQFNVALREMKLAMMESLFSNMKVMRDGGAAWEGVLENFPLMGGLPSKLKALEKKNPMRGKLDTMSDDELADIIADHVNNWIGGIEWAKGTVGQPGWMRQALILTEGWTRARMGNLINLPKTGPKGILARRALMQEQVIVGMMGVAMNSVRGGVRLNTEGLLEARDALTDEDFWDPSSSDFNVVYIGKNAVRLTPHAPEIKALFNSIKGDDRYDSEFMQHAAPLLKFAQDRQGQFVTLGSQWATGEDRLGRKVGLADMATSFAPIILQGAIEGYNGPDITVQGFGPKQQSEQSGFSYAGALGAEWLGTTTYPQPYRLDLAELATTELGRPIDDFWDNKEMPPHVRDGILVSDKARKIIRKKGSAGLVRRMEKVWSYYDDQLKLDELLTDTSTPEHIDHKKWLREYQALSIARGEVLSFIHEESGKRITEPDTEQDKALSGYYDTMKRFSNDRDESRDNSGIFDSAGWADAREVYMDSLIDPDIKAYVTANTSRWATDMTKKFRTASRVMAQYWRIGHESDFAGPYQALWDDYMETGSSVLQDAMNRGMYGDTLKKLKSKQADLRLEARGGNLRPGERPTGAMVLLDQALVRWYDYGAQTVPGAIIEEQLRKDELEALAARL